MKTVLHILKMIAIVAAIGFLAMELTGCPGEGDGTRTRSEYQDESAGLDPTPEPEELEKEKIRAIKQNGPQEPDFPCMNPDDLPPCPEPDK